MNNKIILWVVGVVVIAGIAFYGGMSYGKGGVPVRGQFGNNQFTGGNGAQGGTGMMRGGLGGRGLTSGEIISKDASSITVKMQDGSTRIVLISTSTPIMKSVSGLSSDLVTGINVVVTGTANSDGSVTAGNIQIRPVSQIPSAAGAKTSQ